MSTGPHRFILEALDPDHGSPVLVTSFYVLDLGDLVGDQVDDTGDPLAPDEVEDVQRLLDYGGAPLAGRTGFGGNTWLYSRPIIISTTSLSAFVPAR